MKTFTKVLQKKIILIFLIPLFSQQIFALNIAAFLKQKFSIFIIKEAYPDLNISYSFDKTEKDFILNVTFPDKKQSMEFYWCNGRMLPKDEIKNKANYWSLLYNYEQTLKDPSLMSEQQKELLKKFTAPENRKNGAGTPPFFFDELYDAKTRASLEKHLVSVTFLNKKTTIHKRIKEPLARVEKQIESLAKADSEVKKFVDSLKSADAYYWRIIAGTNRKSFHSYGIALDIIPKRYTGEVFWSWARDHNPTGWMLTPLSRRWLPPKKIVQIFENEGFIWGGKWSIWDNMHFEYHPEIINFNKRYNWKSNK